MVEIVIKRDGIKTSYNRKKINLAITKAMISCGFGEPEDVEKVTNHVENILADKNTEIHVEEIHDIVEKSLTECGFSKVSKAYHRYRKERENVRKRGDRLYMTISNIAEIADRENANVGNGPCAKLLQMGEAASKEKAYVDLLSKDVIDAMDGNKIYPHDCAWYAIGTETCCYIPFDKLLKNGFSTGHGFLRSPKRIKSAAALAAIIFQSNQNDQHGGQASANFDKELAYFVDVEYKYQLKDLTKTMENLGCKNLVSKEEIEKMAWKRTEEETMQAMEAFVYNLNTMHSRAGAQVPFTSANIGTDTSREGRLIAKCLMLAYSNGLGKGEQPLFPNIIFKVKDGVNYEPGTPNHDLLEIAMEVTAKRLYPIYNFQDCTLNKDFPEDVPSMGCRTRVAWDRFAEDGVQTVSGRGNLSFTSINLPGIALQSRLTPSRDKKKIDEKFTELKEKYEINLLEQHCNHVIYEFFVNLNKYIDISEVQLLDRYKYQSKFYKKDFPFLMMQNVWKGAEKIGPNDQVKDILKHGTLTVGFIGLAECLTCLTGKHHAESEESQILGLEIIKFMDKKINKEAPELYNMNYSLLGTPAEGLTGKFLEKDRKVYGLIRGVTDKEWYTNSMHCPVEHNQTLFKKIDIESPYIKYLTGGNITYMELTESPKDNTKAIWKIVQYLHDHDIALGAINFPCDRCRDCGEHGTIDEDHCPVCGGEDISRIRRITGYLAEADNFNHAKKQEMLHRVKHNKPTDF